VSFPERLVLLRPDDVRWVRDVAFGFGLVVGIAIGAVVVVGLWRVSAVLR
jgi:hypothetical protein